MAAAKFIPQNILGPLAKAVKVVINGRLYPRAKYQYTGKYFLAFSDHLSRVMIIIHKKVPEVDLWYQVKCQALEKVIL